MAAIAPAVLTESSIRFYREALGILRDAGVPHLVGGAYAFARYTGIERHTKDFDVFIKKNDFARAAWAFKKKGFKSELTFSHWLGKIWHRDDFVDLIFSAGNGVAVVDDIWFEKAVKETVFDVDVELIPPEEMIWSKGLIMERERYDGADVAHIIHAVGSRLDWDRLIWRYGDYWRVLLAHIILFGFVYPSDRTNVPAAVLERLMQRVREETDQGDDLRRICYGTIISRQQYMVDINERGYEDARLSLSTMTREEIEHWTEGIEVDGADG